MFDCLLLCCFLIYGFEFGSRWVCLIVGCYGCLLRLFCDWRWLLLCAGVCDSVFWFGLVGLVC